MLGWGYRDGINSEDGHGAGRIKKMSQETAKKNLARVKKTPSRTSRPKKPKSAAAPPDNPKLAALKRAHFTKKGRAARIARARKALEEFRWDVDLNTETIKWLAEDPDLEYM